MSNKSRLVNYLQKYATKGEPKRDGSGGGVNANKGRGGCSKEEQEEKASERSRRNTGAPRPRNNVGQRRNIIARDTQEDCDALKELIEMLLT